MPMFPQSYRKKKSGYAYVLSSGIFVLGLSLAAPAAYAGMGGGGGGAAAGAGGAGAGAGAGGAGAGGAGGGGGGNGEAVHRPNGQTELTTCPQGMVWNAKDQRCVVRHSGAPPGARAD
jgi:hypothetical protein